MTSCDHARICSPRRLQRRRRAGTVSAARPAVASMVALIFAGGAFLRTDIAWGRPSSIDLRWLDRVTYGINAATLTEYERLGRRNFLDAQLRSAEPRLPPAIAIQIAELEIQRTDGAALLAEVSAEQKRINALPSPVDKDAAKKVLNERANQLGYEAARRHLLRAIYGRDQLREQLVWFWLNHFSVFSQKASVRWTVGDYEERAIRPHVLGHFRDLVLATLTHPAMLQYLDNAQNAKGHINENYARELLELHTLGVDAGYTQTDVQELARILTGAGVVQGDGPPPKLKPDLQALYLRHDGFEFNPARHEPGDKTLLGHHVVGAGFGEIEQAVDIITHQPACARFIARALAAYFVADDPPPSLVDALAKVFTRTNGDLTQMLRALLASHELVASLGSRLKDPMHFIVSAFRLAYDERPIANAHPVINALSALGEPLYGRPTPDGYPLTTADWASSGQLSRRFEIARTIASGNGGLFEPEDGTPSTVTGFPHLASRLYYELIEANLSPTTRQAFERAASQQEWNTYLLASPEFNHH
jgi:uncharacterized protein (DUF1800 family)